MASLATSQSCSTRSVWNGTGSRPLAAASQASEAVAELLRDVREGAWEGTISGRDEAQPATTTRPGFPLEGGPLLYVESPVRRRQRFDQYGHTQSEVLRPPWLPDRIKRISLGIGFNPIPGSGQNFRRQNVNRGA
jgi:hypothetical protein